MNSGGLGRDSRWMETVPFSVRKIVSRIAVIWCKSICFVQCLQQIFFLRKGAKKIKITTERHRNESRGSIWTFITTLHYLTPTEKIELKQDLSFFHNLKMHTYEEMENTYNERSKSKSLETIVIIINLNCWHLARTTGNPRIWLVFFLLYCIRW